MRDGIYEAIKLLLASDSTVSEEHRQRILTTCRRAQGQPRRRLGTVKQAAHILGCHPRTVYRYVSRGELHVIRHSARKLRFDLDEEESFANQGMQREREEV